MGGGDGEQLYKKGLRQDRRGDTPRRYKKSWRQGTSDNPYNILCAYEEGGDSNNHEKDSEPQEREDEGE